MPGSPVGSVGGSSTPEGTQSEAEVALLPELVPTTPPPKEREYSGRGQKRDLEPQVPPHDPYQKSSSSRSERYREARKQGIGFNKYVDEHRKHNAEVMDIMGESPARKHSSYIYTRPRQDNRYKHRYQLGIMGTT